jgi:hypothetical protein
LQLGGRLIWIFYFPVFCYSLFANPCLYSFMLDSPIYAFMLQHTKKKKKKKECIPKDHSPWLLSFSADFNPPNDRKKKLLLAAVGTVVLSSFIFIMLGILWWKCYLGGRISREQGNLVQMYLVRAPNHS